MDLSGRVAVITGATGKVGQLAARRLAEHGANLVLLGTNQSRLDSLAHKLELAGERYLAHAADLRDAVATQAAAQAVLNRLGRVDILLHLVGGYVGGQPVAEVFPDDINRMLQQHLWTTFHLAQAFGPHLAASGWGRLIVISSPLATQPVAGRAAFAIGKAAQEALVLTLAQELVGTGVTANILAVRAIDEQRERDTQPSPKNAGWTTPEEIVAAIMYLCSQATGVINGARLPLYGG
jgi:NAD(P)-dependent dehydrogenase (short-subunit alcohol dehydrogenase family)